MFSDGPCEADGWKRGEYDELTESRQIRAIIAREVAAATADITSQRDAAAAAACYHIEKAATEPSDEALMRVFWRSLEYKKTQWLEREIIAELRAALKGEGA